jgi:hypothetical protein
MKLTRVQIESVIPIVIAAAIMLLSGCEQSVKIERFYPDNEKAYALDTMRTASTAPQFASNKADEQKLRAGVWGVGTNVGNTSAKLVGFKDEQAELYKSNENIGGQPAPDVAAFLQEQSHIETTLWIIESNCRITNNN